jgi:hypothetical protein
MPIAFRSLVAAMLGAFLLVSVGQVAIKTNDLRNYPNLKPLSGKNNNVTGMADIDPQNPLANVDPHRTAEARVGMTKGEEEAAKRGFDTELASPGK